MTRAGWRLFLCEDCEQFWISTTRDRFSPSGEECENCQLHVSPFANLDQPKLDVSSSGNLCKYEVVIIRKGREAWQS